MQQNQPGTEDFGSFLRTLRKKRSLSVVQVAQVTGLHRATLYRWERGETLPRLTELASILNGLGASREERRQATARMEAPRARTLVQSQFARMAKRAGVGAMPHGGDLLRAMRLRRGMTLDAIALRIGVTSGTLRRWERGDTWPSASQLHQLCFALGANEAELASLTCGEFSRWSLATQMTTTSDTATGQAAERAFAERLDRVQQTLCNPPFDLQDLELLALRSQAWRFATHSTTGLDLLARVYRMIYSYMGVRDRHSEAVAAAEQYLALFPERPRQGPHQSSWVLTQSYLVRDRIYAQERPASKRSVEDLHRVSDLIEGKWQQVITLAMMAAVLQHQDAHDEALQASEKAFLVAEQTMIAEHVTWHRGEWGTRLIRAGRYEQGLALLSTGHPGDWYRLVETSLWKAEAYLGMGEYREAQSSLTQAQSDLTRYEMTPLQSRLNALQAQLYGQ